MRNATVFPPNDIITMALTEAGENPDQQVSVPPYSSEVVIAKKHVEDVVQQALLDFEGLFGHTRASLQHFVFQEFDVPSEEQAWVFKFSSLDMDERSIELITSIYYYCGAERIPVKWKTRIVNPDAEGTATGLPSLPVIITNEPNLPSELYCDFIYLYNIGGGDHIVSAGYDYKFARYASYLLAQKISRGLGNIALSQNLIVLGRNYLLETRSQMSNANVPHVTGGFLSSA